jgi:HK97 family phage major capsid protein
MNRKQKDIYQRNQRLKWLAVGPLLLLGLLFLPMLATAFGVAPEVFATSLAGCGLCFGTVRFLHKAGDDEGGGGADLAMLEKIERGITTLAGEVDTLKKRTPVETILSEPDRWPKELKAIAEENTKLKQTANGFDSEIKLLQRQLAKMEKLAQLEARMSFHDPVKRFLADEDKRNWLNAIARVAAFGHRSDFKLPEHLQKALTGADSSLGQAVIPTNYIPEIYEILSNYGAYNTLRVDTGLSARTNSYPIMTAEPAAVIIGAGTGTAEGSAITEGTFTGTSVNLLIQTIAAYVLASREQLADATVDMSSQIMRSIARSIAKKLDFIAFAADGGADQTDGGYHGLFNTAVVHTGSDAVAAAGNITVATTDLDDWVACQTLVTEEVLNGSPKWWMHPQILAKVCLIRDLNGRPIFQNALEAPSTTVGSILGAPVAKAAAAPSADEASAKIAVYGDPEGYVVGIRQDAELASSEHVKFAENLVAFRALLRAGGKHRIPTGNPAGHIPFAVLTLPGA